LFAAVMRVLSVMVTALGAATQEEEAVMLQAAGHYGEEHGPYTKHNSDSYRKGPYKKDASKRYKKASYKKKGNVCKETMRAAPNAMKDAMGDICAKQVIYLSNRDFEEGTYVIDTPGIYVLTEDIVMRPNGPEVNARMQPMKNSSKYRFEQGYWLGFFAAIAISVDDVFIDLNQKSIKQSRRFQARQRFFTSIQLGDKPFKAGTGPPQFKALKTPLVPANNVVITNGRLGRSSHMGIHGINVNNIWVHKLHIEAFETGGIQVNGCKFCYITESNVGPSSRSVPALATLSQANLLLRIMEAEQPELLTTDPFLSLALAVDSFIDGTCQGTLCEVFRAPVESDDVSTLPDGSALYGILFHKAAPAIHEFMSCADVGDSEQETFGPVFLQDVQIKGLRLRTDEIATMKVGEKVVMGPAGDVFQVHRVHKDGNYNGNVLSDAQVAVGQLWLDVEQVKSGEELFSLYGSTYMPAELLDWAHGSGTLADVEEKLVEKKLGVSYECNHDCMGHFNKGVMGIRLTLVDDVSLQNVRIKQLSNFGHGTTHSACDAFEDDYIGNDVRGMVAFMSNITATGVKVNHLESDCGSTYAFEQRHQTSLVGTVDTNGYAMMLGTDI